jgi:predicted nuclease of predicted toxin-antitoxin system
VRLLFDNNLSSRLPRLLDDLFPNAVHVEMVGLERASDDDVWWYARDNDCIVVTKDSDFRDFSVLRGFPPRVVLLRIGNCSTAEIESLLRRSHATILAFVSEATTGLLTLIGR